MDIEDFKKTNYIILPSDRDGRRKESRPLIVLKQSKEVLTAIELADRSGITRRAIHCQLRKLEKAGKVIVVAKEKERNYRYVAKEVWEAKKEAKKKNG